MPPIQPEPLTPEVPDTATHLSANDARQGIMTGHMRWVLAISLPLATVAVVVVWLVYAGAPH
jgi:hypothetical protein